MAFFIGLDYLGRFARGGRMPPVDPYAFADDRAKELPATPTSPTNGYFDASTSPGGGLGRKTSILKKNSHSVSIALTGLHVTVSLSCAL